MFYGRHSPLQGHILPKTDYGVFQTHEEDQDYGRSVDCNRPVNGPRQKSGHFTSNIRKWVDAISSLLLCSTHTKHIGITHISLKEKEGSFVPFFFTNTIPYVKRPTVVTSDKTLLTIDSLYSVTIGTVGIHSVLGPRGRKT